jgi:hypothetical protein
MAEHAMSGDRPIFPNHVRDLAPEVARIAVFVVAIGPAPKDGREAHETTVAGCEGAACVIPTKQPNACPEACQEPNACPEARQEDACPEAARS